jgi:hypothetical protein
MDAVTGRKKRAPASAGSLRGFSGFSRSERVRVSEKSGRFLHNDHGFGPDPPA